MLVAMDTTLTDHHQHLRRRRLLVISMVLAAVSDVSATLEMTSVGPAASSSEANLTLVLLTPFEGYLGFEQTAAASTRALQQAHEDGLLPGMTVRYTCRHTYL